MPTPYGFRGGLAFGADELRVLRRALAVALHPAPLSGEDVRECLRLVELLDEAVREAGRSRAFLLADLGRYRAALPGSTAGYLELLREALDAGYQPLPDDLAALRALRGNSRAAALLGRLTAPTGRTVPAQGSGRAAVAGDPGPAPRLFSLPGGRASDEPPPRKPKPRQPAQPKRPAPKPAPSERPVPKPSEVFPPRRRPKRPPSSPPPPEKIAVGWLL